MTAMRAEAKIGWVERGTDRTSQL